MFNNDTVGAFDCAILLGSSLGGALSLLRCFVEGVERDVCIMTNFAAGLLEWALYKDPHFEVDEM